MIYLLEGWKIIFKKYIFAISLVANLLIFTPCMIRIVNVRFKNYIFCHLQQICLIWQIFITLVSVSVSFMVSDTHPPLPV